MNTYMSTMDTPAGPLTIVVDADGAVLASGFTTRVGELLPLVHRDLLPDDGPQPRSDLGPATKAALAYFEGDVAAIDAIPVLQRAGGTFLEHAWTILRHVPAGAPISYTTFAGLAGRPDAIRAAGLACARNAAALFVPCHRVFRSDGTLAGFRYGLPVKRWLLDHEHSYAGQYRAAAGAATT